MNPVVNTLRSVSLGIAIAILYPMMIYWGLVAVRTHFFTQPNQERSENQSLVGLVERFAQDASAAGFKLLDVAKKELGYTVAPRLDTPEAKVERQNFYTYAIAGAVAIILGLFLLLAPAGFGFIVGGAILMFKAYRGYWGYLTEPVKFTSLILAAVLALALVVFISYRLMYKKE